MEMGLIMKLPAEVAEDGLDEGLFKLGLGVVGEVGGFGFPEGFEAAEDGGGLVAEFGVFGFEVEAVLEPMVGEELAVADGAEGQEWLV